MMRNINKELIILIIGRILQVLIMLVGIKISTALLSPSEMGNLYLIMSICSFFGLFFINPIGQYINRKTHEWYQNGMLANKLWNYNYYVLLASLLSVFVVMGLYDLGFASNVNYLLLVVFIPLFVFLNTWNQTLIPMLNMLEHRAIFTALTILTLLVSLVLSYCSIMFFGKEGVVWFMGQSIGLGLMAIVSLIYFIQKIGSKLSISIAYSEITRLNFKYILSFSFPLSIGVLFLWMQSQSYRLIIEKFIGVEFLGYFGVGVSIATAISSSFEAIVMQFLYPKMYKNMNDEVHFKIVFSDILNTILPIYFLVSLFVSFLAIYLTTILVDVKYASSFLFVIFGIWIEFFRMSSNLISTIAHSKMQTKTLVFPYAFGGIMVLLGTYVASFSQNYELLVPMVLIMASFLTFVTMYQKMNKIVIIELSVKNFLKILPYTFGFILALLFYEYAHNLILSIVITSVFGIYFLFVLYKFLYFRGVIK